VNILLAEDDSLSRHLLRATLLRWSYQVEAVADSQAALEALQRADGPKLALLDWMMPGLDGPEICCRLRQGPSAETVYLILLTARGRPEDIVAGLSAGANDYITKPFDLDELRARLQVGVRMVELQQSLANRVRELSEALAQVKQLRGLLPICAYCKKIRDDHNYWQQVEAYFAVHTQTQFSHAICPDCFQHVVEPELREYRAETGKGRLT
jgi:DNA-binding response OmpR family regulator